MEKRRLMANGKALRLWLVNVVSFILFSVLGLTGLVNWLVLPHGYEARGSALVTLRHFFREVHEWAALGFMICIGLHIFLHWPYVRNQLERYGILKKKHLSHHGN
jgi:Domain of unknown function (DUF4405)